MITRKREFEDRIEEAVLDFFVVNEKMRPFLKKMLIDEKREYCLQNLVQLRKNKRVIETDHNAEILELNLEFSQKKPERQEMFNLKNKACQEVFKEVTENNENLLNCFDNDLPLEVQSKKWKRNFTSILHQSCRKIRITDNNKKTSWG